MNIDTRIVISMARDVLNETLDNLAQIEHGCKLPHKCQHPPYWSYGSLDENLASVRRLIQEGRHYAREE